MPLQGQGTGLAATCLTSAVASFSETMPLCLERPWSLPRSGFSMCCHSSCLLCSQTSEQKHKSVIITCLKHCSVELTWYYII